MIVCSYMFPHSCVNGFVSLDKHDLYLLCACICMNECEFSGYHVIQMGKKKFSFTERQERVEGSVIFYNFLVLLNIFCIYLPHNNSN